MGLRTGASVNLPCAAANYAEDFCENRHTAGHRPIGGFETVSDRNLKQRCLKFTSAFVLSRSARLENIDIKCYSTVG